MDLPETIDFSVIVPTRNRHTQLAACLDAAAGLDYPRSKFEVVVVDDGSLSSVEAIVAARRESMQVTLVRQSAGGPALARNRGAAVARGRFLVFTDDDCTPAPDWLDILAQRLAGAHECVVGGRTINALTDSAFSTASQALLTYLHDYYSAHPDKLWFLASCNFALDADGFRSVGGFDPAYPRAAAEDRDLCDRLRVRGYGMTYAPDAVVYHRHVLTLTAFWRQHYGYGRGAYQFRRAHRRRSGQRMSVEPPVFYAGLLHCPFRQCLQRPLTVAALLVLSQIGNAAGFLHEWAVQTRILWSARSP
jgi:GT2 family glycosyltransferase